MGAVPRPAGRRAWLIGGAVVAIVGIAGLAVGIASLMGRRDANACGHGAGRWLEDHERLGATGPPGLRRSGDLRRRALSRLSDLLLGFGVDLGPADRNRERGPGRASAQGGAGRRPILAERGLCLLFRRRPGRRSGIGARTRTDARRRVTQAGFRRRLWTPPDSRRQERLFLAGQAQSRRVVRDRTRPRTGSGKDAGDSRIAAVVPAASRSVTRRQDVRLGHSHGGEGRPRAVRGDRRGEP